MMGSHRVLTYAKKYTYQYNKPEKCLSFYERPAGEVLPWNLPEIFMRERKAKAVQILTCISAPMIAPAVMNASD
jgi:hypothetical protein